MEPNLKEYVENLIVNNDDAGCDKHGDWDAKFKPELLDLCVKHRNDSIITILKECIIEGKFSHRAVEMLCDLLIDDNFISEISKQSLLEILKTSNDHTIRVLALDALAQVYNVTEELKLLYETEHDSYIKYNMQTTMLDAQSKSSTDIFATRKIFNTNPEKFEELLNSKMQITS